jgi:predicted small lipoprotein YifL
MKNSLKLLLVLLLLSLAACTSSTGTSIPPVPKSTTEERSEPTKVVQNQTSDGEGSSPSNIQDIPWDDRSIFSANLISDEQAILGKLEGKSVYHIELMIPDDITHLSGHQEVFYTNMEEEPLEAIYFRLYPNIFAGKASLSSITIDGMEVEPQYELADSAARLALSDPLQPGENVVITMDFTVEVPMEGSGNYGLFGYIDGVLVLHKFYPVIPVFDDEGWNVEIPPTHGDVSYFDASFYIVQVTAPEKLVLTTSGVEVERVVIDGKQTVTFANGPARCFYLAASDLFSVTSEEVGDTEVNSYFLLGSEEGARAALDIAVNSLKSYNTRFGTYPYTELDLASTPMQALGMEYPGITAISTTLYNLKGDISGTPTSIYLESAVAHEVAHQWFYNMVGNDQVDEPWVDEAIVQYATGLYYKDVYGQDGYEGFKNSWNDRWGRVEFADIPIGLPVADYDAGAYGAIVYGRGPLFMDTLAEKMGQEVFDVFLKDYFETNKWGIGTAAEFKEIAESHCNCDLSDLFEEWVY